MKGEAGKVLRSLTLIFGLAVLARAEVRLPALIGDHMVLQRDVRVRIWGRASPKEDVTVAIDGQTIKTRAAGEA
jgi:sialate O-acetylesterase